MLLIEVPVFSYGGEFILSSVRLSFQEPSLVALIGPNGSGKSTLLRIAAGLLSPSGSKVEVQGKNLFRVGNRERARLVAWVPQRADVPFAMTVQEMIRIGRYRQHRPLRAMPAEDEVAIRQASARVGLDAMLERDVETLSGGEWQRALIARAIAQETPVLLLDEPIASLDLRYQEEVYLFLRRLAGQGRLILVADHHIEVAASHADRIVVLDGGKVSADGHANDVITAERIEGVFGIRVRVFADPLSGTPRLSRPDHPR